MSKRKPFFEARDTFLVTTTDKELHGGYMALADSERGDLAMLAGYEVVHAETCLKRPIVLTFTSSDKLEKNGRTKMRFYENGKEHIFPVHVKKLGKRPSPIDTAS